MSILIKNNIFVLNTKKYQYAMGVGEDGVLYHLHWGERVENINDFVVELPVEHNSNYGRMDFADYEYSAFGGALYRENALKCEFCDKTRDVRLVYSSHAVENNALKIILKDSYYKLSVELTYIVHEENDIISRCAVIKNTGENLITLEKAYSAEFSLPGRRVYNVYNDNGTWIGENQIKKQALECGSMVFESRKGNSAHGNSPTVILAQDECEDSGKIFFAMLEYSGNFKVDVNKDGFGKTRFLIGVNDFDFECRLKNGEAFETPVVHFGYARSFEEMSNNTNSFALSNIFPLSHRDKELPVLYNSWEATGFDVNVENQKKLADIAKELDVELFVVDDGWFGRRDDDFDGLGDWYVSKSKFPNGLEELIKYVNSLGMDFGIWLEPEMVNPKSDLYKAHPEWTYHYDTREATQLRNQYVLNLTNNEVEKYIIDCFDKLLSENNIKYIKWDMNRPFSEIGTENLENGKMLWYLHTKAVYRIADYLKSKYPHVEIEACSGGGGRNDWGSFRHFDEIWTSDNTNALDRIDIQNGFSYLNPTKAMRAWVTDNGCAPINFKCNVAMRGSLGIGCDLTRLNQKDLDTIKENIEIYKEWRHIIQFGNRYRVSELDKDEINAVMYCDDAKENGIVFVALPKTRFFHYFYTVCLKGLDRNKIYCVDTGSEKIVKTGSYLMYKGLERKYSGEFVSEIWTIKEVRGN